MGQLEKNDYGVYESAQEKVSIDISDASEFILRNTEEYRKIETNDDRWDQLISDFNNEFSVEYSSPQIFDYFLENNFFLEIRLSGGPMLKNIVGKRTQNLKDVKPLQKIFPDELWSAVKHYNAKIFFIDDPGLI